jgi:hypothetical protein
MNNLDLNKFLIVNEYLQLNKYTNFFSGGKIINFNVKKLFFLIN